MIIIIRARKLILLFLLFIYIYLHFIIGSISIYLKNYRMFFARACVNFSTSVLLVYSYINTILFARHIFLRTNDNNVFCTILCEHVIMMLYSIRVMNIAF